MFSKILAFGLVALTLVRAAPSFQAPMVSCSVNLDVGSQNGIPAAAGHFGRLEQGNYLITNIGSGTELRSYRQNDPIFVAMTREFPGPFGEVSALVGYEGQS
jgi:hypothetical protein